MTAKKIDMFWHCKKCLEEKPDNISPQDYARISCGWTEKGVQAWCDRHDISIVALDFMGQKVTYDV